MTGWWASRSSPARPPGWPTAPARPRRAATPSSSAATPTSLPTPGTTDRGARREGPLQVGPVAPGLERQRVGHGLAGAAARRHGRRPGQLDLEGRVGTGEHAPGALAPAADPSLAHPAGRAVGVGPA